jgi:putative DNA primase/helicase
MDTPNPPLMPHEPPGDRVEFTRDGKTGGQSFNVKLIRGVPITYNFSDNTGIPTNQGLSPSQMRCFYEFKMCDREALNRFSDILRAELGWPSRRPPSPRPTLNGTTTAEGDPLAEERFRATDAANAKRFAADHNGRALFVNDWRSWYVFDGKRWVGDPNGTAVLRLALDTAKRMGNLAAQQLGDAAIRLAQASGEVAKATAERDKKAAEEELKWAKKSEDAKKLGDMVKIARSHLSVAKGAEVFDTARYLLNCPNGTVDLRSGELRPHDPADYITKLCPTKYDPNATARRYRQFLAQVLPDATVADYVREVGGYAATGEVTDQSLHLFVGEGSNGKSVLLKVWSEVLGEYAATAPPELIADHGESRHPTEKTILRGARLAVCFESEEDAVLNEPRVKALTGSDAITARDEGELLPIPAHAYPYSGN